jgi:hypothetical protein
VARSFRYGLIAAGLLILTEGAALLLAAPVSAVTLPPVKSLQVRGWAAGQIIEDYRVGGTVRLVQSYGSTVTGDTAAVETRCSADPKDFLKWSGKLAYLGAGYEQLSATTERMAFPSSRSSRTMTGTLSAALMRAAGSRVLIVYAYLDHWGIHAETAGLWPRAIADLLTRHPGPYCNLGIAVTIGRSQQRADAEAQYLTQAFLPRIAALIDD